MNQEGGISMAGLGSLSVQLTAQIAVYRKSMQEAIGLLQRFTREAKNMGGSVSFQFQEMGSKAQDSIHRLNQIVRSLGQGLNTAKKDIADLGKRITNAGRQLRDETEKTHRVVSQRGKQGLGAILTFSEGVKRFISLNMRWFLVWRSFWAIWGQVQRAFGEFRDLMDETALALRTGVENLASWSERQIVAIQIQERAIASTMRHAVLLKDYIKSFYYLTTAGIDATNALQFANSVVTTSIALHEKSEVTVRLLTGLYNVFGETMRDIQDPLERFNKVAAILTATFAEQDIELADYAKALPYVAQNWKLAGGTLETLVAALGVMGTRFIRGSKSATSLSRSLDVLMKYPERFAKLTGMAFDPSKPLDYIAAIRGIRRTLRTATRESKEYGIAVETASKLVDLFGMRGKRASLTLIDAFEDLEKQIERNVNATFEMTQQMADLAEATVPKQFQIMMNILRGWLESLLLAATQSADFVEALKRINSILRNLTPIFKAAGMLLRTFTSDLGSLIAAGVAFFAVWKKGSLSFIGSLHAMAAGAQRSFLAIGAAMKKFIPIFWGIQAAMSTVQLAHEAMHQTLLKNAAKYGLQLELTEKRTWQKILGYITDVLSPARLIHRIFIEGYRKDYRAFLAERKAEYERAVKEEEMTQTEANHRLIRDMASFWDTLIGERLDYQSRLGLARDQNLEREFKAFERYSEFMREKWPKLYDDILKIRESSLAYELYQLRQQYEKQLSDLMEAGGRTQEAVANLENWYGVTRLEIIRKYEQEILDLRNKFRRQAEFDQLSEFDQEVERLRQQQEKNLEEAASAFVQRAAVRVESMKIEAEQIRELQQEVEKKRLQIEKEGFQEASQLREKEIQETEKTTKAQISAVKKVLAYISPWEILQDFRKSTKKIREEQVEADQDRVEQAKETTETVIETEKETLDFSEELSRLQASIRDRDLDATQAAIQLRNIIYASGDEQLIKLTEEWAREQLAIYDSMTLAVEKIIEKRQEAIRKATSTNLEWTRKAEQESGEINLLRFRKDYDERIKITNESLAELKKNRDEAGEFLLEDMEKLEQSKSEMTEAYRQLELRAIKDWNQRWAAEDERIFGVRYRKVETTWEHELSRFHEFYNRKIGQTQDREEEILKLYERGSKEELAEREKLRERIRQSEEMRTEDLRVFVGRNTSIYYEYLSFLDEESLRTATSISDQFSAMWDLIGHSFQSAIARTQEQVGTNAERLSGLYEGSLEDLSHLTSDYLGLIVNGHKYAGDQITEIWNTFLVAIRRRIADFLASQVMSEFLSFLGRAPGAGQPRGRAEGMEQIGDLFAGLVSGLTAGVEVRASPARQYPAGTQVTVSPPEMNATIVNVMDPTMIPAGMLRNRSVILNVINDDIFTKGLTYSAIKGV